MLARLINKLLDRGPCDGRHKGICSHAERGEVVICGANNPGCEYAKPLQKVVRYEIVGDRLPVNERLGAAQLSCSYRS
jgi:hypothetical protein